VINTNTEEEASMLNNDANRHMPFSNRAEMIQNKTRYSSLRCSLLAICLLVVCCTVGCFGEVQNPNLQLNLNVPTVKEKDVSLNGSVSGPVQRLQWEWGDGHTDMHHFFPASHTYNKPGTYQITVTAFDSTNKGSSKSVSVEIK